MTNKDAKPQRFTLHVPIAASPSSQIIRRGSAIVGRAMQAGDLIILDYEGNLYDAANMQTYEDRLQHAAGRASASYPTIARIGLPLDDAPVVGFCSYMPILQAWVVEELTDPATLASWLGEEGLPQIGGSDLLRHRAAGIHASRMPGHKLAELQTRAKTSTKSLTELILDAAGA